MAPVTGKDVAYLYDGSFDGLLTAVFEAYSRGEQPALITTEDGAQLSFGQEAVHIHTGEEKARRVERGILKTMGEDAYGQAWTAFLSPDPDRETKIYRYLRLGFSVGRRLYSHLAHDDVLPVNNLCRYVEREAHHFKMFVRFSEMEGGVFYAKIEPNCNVLPLIMPHFTDRYSVQPFLIHDTVHGLAGVFNLQEWTLVEAEHLNLPELAENELEYRRLWKHFYDSVAVLERANPRCRMNFMPKRFWHNITEMNYVERTRAPDPHRRLRGI